METDPRFATNDARLAHHAEFKARVEAILATAPVAEWVARLEAATVAAGPVYEFHEVFEDPQVRHLGLVAEMEQPGAGRVRILGFPGQRFGDAAPHHTPRAAPRPAHRGGAGRARALARGDRPARLGRRRSSWAKTPEPCASARQARGAEMMTWRVITMVVAGMLAVAAAREANPAAPGDGLVGTTWHTVRIDGDALFFVIRTSASGSRTGASSRPCGSSTASRRPRRGPIAS